MPVGHYTTPVPPPAGRKAPRGASRGEEDGCWRHIVRWDGVVTGGFLGFAARRTAAAIPTLFGVTVIVFFMIRILPGDPARLVAGLVATDDEVARIRVQLGLTKPLVVQYGLFLDHLLRGDLGKSIKTQAPVTSEIGSRLPPTALLAATATSLAGVLGIASGILVSTRKYTAVDYLVTVMALAGVSIPVFWLGLMLMLLFAVFLHLVPAGGAIGPLSIILPSITLAAFSIAIIERMTRNSMLESLQQDYVRSQAFGLFDCIFGVRGFTADRPTGITFQYRANTLSNNRVIVYH